MYGKVSKSALLSAVILAAAACAGPFNGPQHGLSIQEAHPISVDSQTVTLTIAGDTSTSEISDVDRARLRAFADAYMLNGHGPLTITAPSGTGGDIDGHETAADIRKALNDAGVPWSALGGATYRTGATADGVQLIVSYTHYVATPSECGVWTGTRSADYRNLRSPNMGCATMNNYAAMIADPHELIAPADIDPRDGDAVVRAIELYRAGEVTASDVDNAIDAGTGN